ncbi:hypothetical protein [Williamsia phyllosphaerae]|nr:hypothetical protein [Williamsia phyllosphaerae]
MAPSRRVCRCCDNRVMPSRRLVAMEVAAVVVAVVVLVAGCSVRAVDPRRTPAATPATSSATPKVRYFTAPPIGVEKNPAARCIDATLPNITLDDYLADWRTIFADQRNAHPEGSFPTDAGSDAQRSERWASAPQILADITPGADARFAADVCGLSTIDGALYSGLELRKLRGHVASLGRETCITIADDGTKAVWERSRSLSRDDGQRLASEYQIYSAIKNVCPQLVDFTVPPNQIQKCSEYRPDPSAREGDGYICLGG